MAAGGPAGPDNRERAGFSRRGGILPDVSQAARSAGADVHRGVCGFGGTVAELAARLQRSAGDRGDRTDGAVAARTVGLRSQSIRREQWISGARVGLSLFLCTRRRTQSQAGAQGGISLSLFCIGLRRFRTDPERWADLKAENAGSAWRKR